MHYTEECDWSIVILRVQAKQTIHRPTIICYCWWTGTSQASVDGVVDAFLNLYCLIYDVDMPLIEGTMFHWPCDFIVSAGNMSNLVCPWNCWVAGSQAVNSLIESGNGDSLNLFVKECFHGGCVLWWLSLKPISVPIWLAQGNLSRNLAHHLAGIDASFLCNIGSACGV